MSKGFYISAGCRKLFILAFALWLVGCGKSGNSNNSGKGPTSTDTESAIINFTGDWQANGVVHQESGHSTNCSSYTFRIDHSATELIIWARTINCPGILLKPQKTIYQIEGTNLKLNGTVVGTISSTSFHLDYNSDTLSIEPGGFAFVLNESYSGTIYLQSQVSKN